MGQYLGSGGMTLVSQLCPMLKGVGVATMMVVGYLDIYYCVIIAWTFFYLFAGFSSLPDLPWDTCGMCTHVLMYSFSNVLMYSCTHILISPYHVWRSSETFHQINSITYPTPSVRQKNNSEFL